MDHQHKLNITIYPKHTDYAPITFAVLLDEYQAAVLMATPVKNIGMSLERAGGYLLDKLITPVEYNNGGNVPR